MHCADCGAALATDASVCTRCGAEVAAVGRIATDGGEEVTLESPASVPDDAVAVDVPCPHCGQNPIESVAKGYRVTGMILIFQLKTLRFVGCQRCIRRKLWWASVKNLLFGWWGIRSAVFNLFAVPWNAVRGLVPRGPNQNLVEALDETGIPYSFISDEGEFDPTAHHDEELYLNGMLRLAVAMMRAGDGAGEAEARAVLDVAGEMFPDYDDSEIRDRMKEFAEEDVDVEEVSAALGTMLTDEGKQMVVTFAMAVAAADEEVEEAEQELIAEIVGRLGLSERQMQQLLAE